VSLFVGTSFCRNIIKDGLLISVRLKELQVKLTGKGSKSRWLNVMLCKRADVKVERLVPMCILDISFDVYSHGHA